MAKESKPAKKDRSKHSRLYPLSRGKGPPVREEDWDEFVAREPKLQKRFPLKRG